MKKIPLILWLTLIVYTMVYLLVFGVESQIITLLLIGEADAFAAQFFNVMGLVPFYFLLDYLYFQNRRKFGMVPYLLGFIGGAFSILWGFNQVENHHHKFSMLAKIFLSLIVFLTIFVIYSGFTTGNPELYFNQFLDDALVGIMTVDFFVLYGWSILRSKQLFKSWYVAFIPMIGYGLLMLWNQRR